MLTQADKKFLKTNFATKDDLTSMEKRQNDRFATKDDLRNDLSAMEKRMDAKFATKDDLRNDLSAMEKRMDAKFATKDDIKKFATKDDLKDQRDQILDAVDGKLVKLKDGIVKDVGEYIADTIVPLFDKHEKRITRVEKKLGLPLFAD
ncbi:MAG: hypothetical protein AAB508_06430 [Patescibacteria group bacterium]